MNWNSFLQGMPFIAILRGLTPGEAVAIAVALQEAGVICLEVPLNSPDPFRSITAIRGAFEGKLLVGAGTVLTPDDVIGAADAGAQFVVSPNTDPNIVEATKAQGMRSIPGFFTPTEALAAARAGADALKLFPAEGANPAQLKALKAVLPAALPVFAVGGVTETTLAPWRQAGVAGFGIGGALYRPGDAPGLVRKRALKFVAAYRESCI